MMIIINNEHFETKNTETQRMQIFIVKSLMSLNLLPMKLRGNMNPKIVTLTCLKSKETAISVAVLI
jgi:hypothetical protein